MYVSVWIDSFLVFAISLAIRIFSVRGALQDYDSRAHLYWALKLKQSGGGPFSPVSVDVVTSAPFYYPFMWHWLISRLPLRYVLKYQAIANPLLDAFFCIVVFHVAIGVGFSQREAYLATALYLTTPMWFSRFSMGPRIRSFTPRLSGEIATNCFFVFSLLPLNLPTVVTSSLAVIFGIFTLTSSKFGIQALIFLTPLVTIFTNNAAPVGYLAVSLALVVALSGGAYWKALSTQVSHLTWYFRKNIKREMPVSNRNTIGPQFKKIKEESISRYFFRIFSLCCSQNSYAGVLIKLPLLIFLIGSMPAVEIGRLPQHIIMPVFAAVVVYVLINIPVLLFLGEAERYINHVAIFVVLAAVSTAGQMGVEVYLCVFVAYGMLWIFFEGGLVPRLMQNSIGRETDANKVIEFLKKYPKTVVVNFPFHACGGIYRIMTETHHETVFVDGQVGIAHEYAARFAANYPFIKLESLNEMKSDLGVTVLIVNNLDLKRQMGCGWRPPLEWRQVDIGCSLHTLYVASSANG